MSSPLLIVASIFLSAFLGLNAVGMAGAGPVAIVAGLGALGWTLRARRLPWASVGLGAPGPAWRVALAALGCMLAGWLAAGLGMLLAVRGLGWAPVDTSRFADLPGDTAAWLGMLAISWTTAAFGEEVLFRGFLQGRLRELFAGTRHAGLLAALVQAVLFGLGHAYQGATGILVTGFLGLAFGLCALRLRSVWPLVIAHGLIDTVSMTALYLGQVPGA